METRSGILYVIGSPIGNLEDITLRALRILKEVDVILCEDTRVTTKLLDRYDIKKRLLSYHQHSRLSRVAEILALLRAGKNLALVSDAGTPGISDPGNELIEHLLDQTDKTDKTDKSDRSHQSDRPTIVPIPGPSAVIAIASVAGIPMQRFYFAGYPPTKKGRKAFFKNLAAVDAPVILFESPHRIIRTLHEINETMKPFNHKAIAVVGRELTKKFETIYRGSLKEIVQQIEKEKPRGEYVIVIEAKQNASRFG